RRIAGHCFGGVASLTDKTFVGHRGLGQCRRGTVVGPALPDAAMACVAVIGEIEAFAVCGIATRSPLCLRGAENSAAENRGEYNRTHEPVHVLTSSTRIGDDVDHR